MALRVAQPAPPRDRPFLEQLAERVQRANEETLAGLNPSEFEAVIKELCDPIFAKPLNEISFGQFLVQLFQAAGKFNMEIQPQLVLLQKTLLYIEGLGRQLYPQLDLWETAKPFMESWMAQRVGPAATLRAFAEQAPKLIAQLPRLPALLATP